MTGMFRIEVTSKLEGGWVSFCLTVRKMLRDSFYMKLTYIIILITSGNDWLI